VGDTGLAVPPRNPKALSLAWNDMLDGSREPMSKAAQRRIETEFSLRAMIDRTEDVLSAEWASY
jgi:glycosyltransferase involved in cell wall biosynthesis